VLNLKGSAPIFLLLIINNLQPFLFFSKKHGYPGKSGSTHYQTLKNYSIQLQINTSTITASTNQHLKT